MTYNVLREKHEGINNKTERCSIRLYGHVYKKGGIKRVGKEEEGNVCGKGRTGQEAAETSIKKYGGRFEASRIPYAPYSHVSIVYTLKTVILSVNLKNLNYL